MKLIEVVVFGSFFIASVCVAFILRGFGLSRILAIPLGIMIGVSLILLALYSISELTNRKKD